MDLTPFKIKLHEYLALHNVRPNSSGLATCPLRHHANDTKPSFSVSGPQGDVLWHCFGCQESGSIFDFASIYHGLPNVGEPGFYEVSLVQIASQLGIDYHPPKKQVEKHQDRMSYYAALRHIVNQLTLGPAEKFLKERGWSVDTARRFKIGVLRFPSRTISELKGVFGEDFIKEHGILNPGILSEKRLIFPVFNQYGAPIALNGRDISGEKDEVKYINSRNNRFFKKGNVLYNCNRVRRMFKKVYIVEGATDVITLSQAGVDNVVALLGTSLSDVQVKLLKEFEKVTLILDSDDSGIKAGKKALDKLLGAYVRLLPAGQDPDEFIRSKGVEEFHSLEYLSKLEFLIEVDDYSHPEPVVRRRLDDVFRAEPFTHPGLAERLARKSGYDPGQIMESIDRRANKAALAVLRRATEGAKHVHVVIMQDVEGGKEDDASTQ